MRLTPHSRPLVSSSTLKAPRPARPAPTVRAQAVCAPVAAPEHAAPSALAPPALRRAQDFAFSAPFARGAFGAVSYAVDVRNPERELVAKTLWTRGQSAEAGPASQGAPRFNAAARSTIAKEITVQKKLRGPLRLVAVIKADDQRKLVMQRMRGSVAEAFTPAQLMQMPAAQKKMLLRSVLADVAEDLSQLHHAGYLHLDTKIENMLVGADGTACVSDFGSALPHAAAARQSKISHGSPHIMSPEMARGLGVNEKSDVWSVFAAWSTAVMPSNYFVALQDLRHKDKAYQVALKNEAVSHDPAMMELAKLARQNPQFAQFFKGDPQPPEVATQTREAAQRARDATLAQVAKFAHSAPPSDPYDALIGWKAAHPLPLDSAQLAAEAPTNALSKFMGALHAVDPELTELALRHIVQPVPEQRMGMAEFAQRLRALQPRGSREDKAARALLVQQLGPDRGAQEVYAQLRAQAVPVA